MNRVVQSVVRDPRARVSALVVAAGVLGGAAMMGTGRAEASGRLPALTLAEVNEAAARLGRPGLARLPWQDESGADVYEQRRAAYAADPEGYVAGLEAVEAAAGE